MHLLTFAATPSLSANDCSFGRLRPSGEEYDQNAGERSCRSGDDMPRAHRTGSVQRRRRARVLPYGVVSSAIRHGCGRRPEKFTLESKSWHKNRVVPLNERRMEGKLNSGDSLTWCFPIDKNYQPKPTTRLDGYSVGQLGFCARIPLFACTFWDNSVSVPSRRVRPPSHLESCPALRATILLASCGRSCRWASP